MFDVCVYTFNFMFVKGLVLWTDDVGLHVLGCRVDILGTIVCGLTWEKVYIGETEF